MAVSNSTDRFNGVLASKAIKVPVKRATNVNQVLSGDPGAIDGWTWSNGDRILLYGQTNPVENGIWEVNLSSSWRRAPDFDGTRDAIESTLITAGRSGSDNPLMYVLTTDADPIRIGTDALAFQVYFDPDVPATADLQGVTDVGADTTNEVLLNGGVQTNNMRYNAANAAGPDALITYWRETGPTQVWQLQMSSEADGSALQMFEVGDAIVTEWDTLYGFGIKNQKALRIYADNETEYVAFQVTASDPALGRLSVTGVGDLDKLELVGMSLYFINQVAANETIASRGQVWVDNSSPNQLIFTDDAGTDWVLNNPDTLQYVTDQGNITTNDVIVSGSSFRVRGLSAGALEEKLIYFEDSGGVAYARIGTQSNGDVEIRNLSQADSIRIMGTLTGGTAHTYLDGNPNSATRVSAAPGRDVAIGIGTNNYIFCDNLGNLDFFYLGTSNVVRMTSAAGGALLVNQTETGESGTFSRALTSFDLGLDAEFWFFDFQAGTTDPTQQRFKFNNADPTLVTILTLDDIAISDRDPVDILGTIQAGTQIRLAQTTDLSIWAVYEATGPAVDNTTHFSIPVAYVAHNGTFPTATRPPFKFTFANTTSNPTAAASASASLVGKWTYSNAVNGGTAPPNQSIEFSNATPTSATRMFIDDQDADNLDWSAHMADAWLNGFGTLVRMRKVDDPQTYMVWSINTATDNVGYFDAYINLIEFEGTWTNGDEMYVEIQTQAYVAPATVDNGVYFSRATLSGQPLCGPQQSSVFRLLSNGWEVFNSGFNVQWTQTGDSVTVTGADYFRWNTEGRHEWYGSANILPVVTIFESLVEFGHDNHAGNGAPVLRVKERTSQGAVEAGWGQIWVRNDTPNSLIFTDDAGNDYDLTNIGGAAQTISAGWTTGSGGSITLAANAPLIHTEQSASDSPGAGEGQFWVRDDAPNRAMFTDDAGNDKVLSPIGTLSDIQYAAPTSAFTLSDASGVQSALPAAIDTFTLEANSTYEFEGVYLIASGATAHTVAMAFAVTTAVVTDINYVTTAWNSAANAIATAQSTKHTNAVGSTVVTQSTTNVRQHIKFKGIIRVTTGGTVVPQIAFSAAPGGTNQMLVGSFIKFKRIGSDTEQTTGGWA